MELQKPRAVKWAQGLLRKEFVIFDFETTGLNTEDDRIVQIGAVDHTGQVLIRSLVKPCLHIPPEATAIHGITNEMVADAPTFVDLHAQLFEALNGKPWIVYNLEFDTNFLIAECKRHWQKVPAPPLRPDPRGEWDVESHCAMKVYAEFWGERRWNGGYRWQSLTNACAQQRIEMNGAHSAVGDCLMTLALLKKMAGVE